MGTINLKVFLFLILAFINKSYGQSDSTTINILVKEIDNDLTLKVLSLDTDDVYNNNYEKGGYVKIYLTEKNEIKKVESLLGLSRGEITTKVYLKNGKPIKVIEKEENFPISNDIVSLTKTSQIFELNMYFFQNNTKKNVEKGVRIFSGGTCRCTDYNSLIELAKKLTAINSKEPT